MEIRTATRKGRSSVILEIAVLNIRPNEEAAFEAAIKRARPLIAATPGFRTIEIHRCVEVPNRYLLLVRWEKIDDHNVGFRQSDRYHEWKKMLHHLYDPLPIVEHYAEPLELQRNSNNQPPGT
jgi:heme-degrading monooxygenase HmoA